MRISMQVSIWTLLAVLQMLATVASPATPGTLGLVFQPEVASGDKTTIFMTNKFRRR